MKILSLLAVLVVSSFASAQTVKKADGDQAVIQVGAETIAVGDEVIFTDVNLNEMGRGKVIKKSPTGVQALVQKTSGSVRVGMGFEKIEKHAPTKVRAEGSSTLQQDELSEEDRRILARGEISDTRYIVGGILATYPLGLGIGHAVQGRYTERGWIFTVGELGAGTIAITGLAQCLVGTTTKDSDSRVRHCDGTFVLGFAAYLGLRVWEAIDAWVVPPRQNRRYHQLKRRTGESTVKFEPLVLPRPDGGMLGMRMTF